MSDTIKLPGLGPTDKKTALMLGGGVVLVAGVAWYRSKKSGASATPATPATDPNATDPNATPYPATGDGTGSNWTPTPAAAGSYTTNAAWAQAAEDYLVNTVGSDAHVVGNALGRYITGRPLTSDQIQIVESAIAFTGYPPVNGPTGHPPAYLTDGSSGSSGGTPDAPGGFHATYIGRDSIRFAWNSVSGASHYTLYRDGQQVTDASGTSATATGLRPGTRYHFTVNAWNSDSSKRSNPASVYVATHH